MLTAAMIVSVAALAGAQQGRGMPPQGDGPRYDVSTEATLTGTVSEVKLMGGMAGGTGRGAGQGMGGTHVILQTGQESIEVHLGPTAFLSEQKVDIQKGDRLEVVGSRVLAHGALALLARQLTLGGRIVTLRSEQGAPLWSCCMQR